MKRFKAALKALMAQLRVEGQVKAAKYSDSEIDEMTADEARAALKECTADAADDDDDDDDEDDDGDKKDGKKSESARKERLRAEMQSIIDEGRKQFAAEQTRQSAIVAACQKERVTNAEIDVAGEKKTVNLAAHAIENNWTIETIASGGTRQRRPQRLPERAAHLSLPV